MIELSVSHKWRFVKKKFLSWNEARNYKATRYINKPSFVDTGDELSSFNVVLSDYFVGLTLLLDPQNPFSLPFAQVPPSIRSSFRYDSCWKIDRGVAYSQIIDCDRVAQKSEFRL